MDFLNVFVVVEFHEASRNNPLILLNGLIILRWTRKMIMETRDGMKILPWKSIVRGVLFCLPYLLEVIFFNICNLYVLFIQKALAKPGENRNL